MQIKKAYIGISRGGSMPKGDPILVTFVSAEVAATDHGKQWNILYFFFGGWGWEALSITS